MASKVEFFGKMIDEIESKLLAVSLSALVKLMQLEEWLRG